MVIKADKETLTKPFNIIFRKSSKNETVKPGDSVAVPTADNDKALFAAEDAAAAAGSNERGVWGSQWDFAMSCIAYAVGLGNVWRFPYLCFKNGGGAFLIPYFIAMLTCGIPLFLLEVSVGQYLGVGGMSVVGQLCPIFKGVGFSALMMVFLECVYYVIVVAWTLFYILNTFYNITDGLPWSSCEKGNGTWAHGDCYDAEGHIPFENSTAYANNFMENETSSPVEQYWNNHVLQISDGIETMGSVRLELFGYLVLAWVLVYLVIWKGLQNSGKIIWVSAISPYVLLSILCVKALTLPGAFEGLKFLFTPDWEILKTSQCWIDGGTQIFFSYGVGIGALLALGSYNKFNHNVYRDSIVICCINTFTSFFSAIVIFSILGFMANAKGVDIGDVVKSGPGLAFLVYPEVVLQLDPSGLWSILFFLMLFCLGADSQFCCVESLMTGLIDNWPEYLRPRKIKFTFFSCIFMLALGIPMITEGGVYIFQLMDFYAASGMSLLWCTFFQTVAICWFFGGKKMYDCIEQMVGFRINWYWYICWMAIGPAFMVFLFVFYFAKYTPITYGGTYAYPWWGEALGFCISGSSMIWVPGYAIYFLLTTEGTFQERLRIGITPTITPRPDAVFAMENAERLKNINGEDKDVEMNLVADNQNHV